MDSAVADLRNQGLRIDVINARTHPAAVEQYQARSLPTFIYYRNGEEVRRTSGNLSKVQLKMMWLEPLFF